MRVTNQMVTSNSLRNMQKSMQKVSNLNEQVTTGKKISAPSEDPVIAIRALKLRTTVDQLYQYKNKNIPDAMSWLDTTQSSIKNVFDQLSYVYEKCELGAHDTFSTDDRKTVINDLRAMKDSIYHEGTMTYAGRYMFSGYKTETCLLFQDDRAKEGLSYNITQEIEFSSIEVKDVVINEIPSEALDDTINGTNAYKKPETASVYRIKLAYDDIDVDPSKLSFTYTTYDGSGNPQLNQFNLSAANTMLPADSAKYYDLEGNASGIHFIPETGEIVFGEDVYNQLKNSSDIKVSYDKSNFEVGDLRPEMYFNCVQTKTTPEGPVVTNYTMDEKGQPIEYEVNFNQMITVNAQGKDFITHDMGNRIDDMARAVQDVLDIEETIERLKKKASDPQYANDDAAQEKIKAMLEGADIELAVKKENMQRLFGNNMTNFQNYMEQVSAVQAEVGSTYSKLELIEVRVQEQYDNFRDLKSVNEDVETEEVAIDLYQSELVYDASLSTTATVIKKTLLDYL